MKKIFFILILIFLFQFRAEAFKLKFFGFKANNSVVENPCKEEIETFYKLTELFLKDNLPYETREIELRNRELNFEIKKKELINCIDLCTDNRNCFKECLK